MKKNPLDTYNKKRNFKKTEEPEGKIKNSTAPLIFVVQEHHARALHYDFRLEWEGVLKSWAIPKGPSMDPSIKRLAAQTEDHPVSYSTFEGTIPKGEYGGGEVSIWDAGTWEPLGDAASGLTKGKLEFILKGKKLKGKFALIKTKFKGSSKDSNWLLIKAQDEEAQIETITPTQAKSSKKISIKKVSKKKSPSKFTSPDKILYPKEGITKEEIKKYYQSVAKFMLPHLKNRPLSLVRCPRGTEEKCFYQKHPLATPAEGINTFLIEDNDPKTNDEYLTINTKQGLIDLVQLNSFEIHAWNCFYKDVLSPNQIVMDFDPDEGVPWQDVVNAAFELKDLLESMNLKCFVKLTGGKGLHVHIPLKGKYTWEEVKDFSKNLADKMVRKKPKKYLSAAAKNKRKGKIFIDYLRNAYGATAVVPYSLRAKEQSSVALPLSWNELKRIKSPRISLKDALKKITTRTKDPWAGILKLKQSLPSSISYFSHSEGGEQPPKSGDDEFS